MDWNTVCLNSIQKEKAEIGKRYNIRFGQTEIYCARCERPVTDFLKHICADLRLQTFLKGQKEEKDFLLKKEKENNDLLIKRIRAIGRTKIATLLELNIKTISHWIDRRKIPHKYQKIIFALDI